MDEILEIIEINTKEISKKKTHYFLKIFVILFISILYVELVFRYLTFKSLYDIEIIRIILFTFTTSLFISFIATLGREKFAKTIVFFSAFLMGIYAILQLNFYNFMGNYMSLNAAGDGLGRVTEEIKTFFLYIKPIYYLCLLPTLLIIILFIFAKSILIYEKPGRKTILVRIITIILIHLVSLSTLYIPMFQNPNQIKENKSLYRKPVLLELSLRQFGTTRFLIRDFIYMFNPIKENLIVIEEEKPEEPVEPDYTRNIDDTEWKNLIDNETNNSIKNLHEYYLNQKITPKNDMTGVFKDKNLIYIMVEAFDIIAIDEKLTPTLYKLYNEGMRFDNYYAPKYSCTTGESEYIGLTSIIPSSTVCTPNTYKNNDYSTSIFKLFENHGYYNTSYHNYSDKYYARTILHKNMGSLKFYNDDDLDIKKIWGWPSDLNLMKEAIPLFIDEEKFFSFIITSTTHFPYDGDGHVGVVLDHWSKVKDLPYNIKIKRYMAKAIELDLSLQYLIESLEEKGIMDDTVLVLFGDHHPLNMEYTYLNEASPYDRLQDFNIDKLPFIIYNSEIEPIKISKTASTFDILPTLANMFDLDYDPRYYVGKDLLSDEETIVIFTTGSWITDKAIYFASSGNYKELQETDDDYISRINQKVNNYFTASEQTLKLDYFKYRFKT
ncbi:MAG: sulfatase-like hydrolase/transferase [Bacilli bacterium]|nr:sulfatase-like hydrolase/transferase [Bacilli bacterium]MDD4282316.1 sulfatase-like hydrolase/transferase [Bacilli bacterium]